MHPIKTPGLVAAILSITFLICCYNSVAQSRVSNNDESKVPPYILPDPLKMPDGKEVTTKEEWITIQRPRIYHLYEEIQFGRFPLNHPPLRYRVMETADNALQGRATRRQVRIYLHPADTTVYIDLLMYLPNKIKKPVPVFIGYNF
ncbi:MAG TPA: acetylxylan esterase, partial [Candidatus Paceibacterota bacterium]|nr:acetylxylan esterase [Candidatus Paceibacterota bacterium]